MDAWINWLVGEFLKTENLHSNIKTSC